MPKTVIAYLALALIFGLAISIAEAGLLEEDLQVIDNEYQDEVFGGSEQPTLIITFTPGDDLVDNGDYAVIVDADDDGDFDDEPNSSYIETGTAVPDSPRSVTWSINSKLSSLKDGNYDIAVVIDNLPNGKIDWGDEVSLFSVTDATEVTNITGSLPAIHDDLRSKFGENGISLSNNLTVSGSDPRWEIADNDKNRTYIVRAEGGNLRVSQEIERDDDEEDFTLDRTLEITEVDVDPDIFSPNGDGVRDTTTIYYTLSESLTGRDEEMVITIGEGQLSSPAKPVAGTGKGRNSVVWDGKDGVGRYVEDGTYTIKIEAKDLGGNEATATTQVKARTELPEVVSTVPELDSFVAILTEVKATLKDNSGEGIDLEKSKIRLKDPPGKEVAGFQRDDGEAIIRWRLSSPLPGDGSVDGQYTIVVTAVDKVGNTETTNYTFFYDTVFPQITSVTPANGAVLTTAPPKIIIVMSDDTGSGPDLAATAQALRVNVDGNNVAGSTIHDGADTITFTPLEELDTGRYTIEVSPTDLAGNKPSQPLVFLRGRM